MIILNKLSFYSLKLLRVCTHQKGTEHVEADKVNDGELAATVLVGRAVFIGRSFLTLPTGRTRQHDLLPRLTCCTSDRQMHAHTHANMRAHRRTCKQKRHAEKDTRKKQRGTHAHVFSVCMYAYMHTSME